MTMATGNEVNYDGDGTMDDGVTRKTMMMIVTGQDDDICSMNSYQSSIIWIHAISSLPITIIIIIAHRAVARCAIAIVVVVVHFAIFVVVVSCGVVSRRVVANVVVIIVVDRRYQVICAIGWMVKRERGKRSFRKNWSIRVGTEVGKMTTTKQHTAPEGEEHNKYKTEKKSPLVPRYILRAYQEIWEGTWIKRPE